MFIRQEKNNSISLFFTAKMQSYYKFGLRLAEGCFDFCDVSINIVNINKPR